MKICSNLSVCISLYSTLFLLVAMAGCGKGKVIERPLDDSTQAPIEGAVPAGMVLIPAGTFQMGSYDPGSDDRERPLHTVYVDAFYMDKTEVTNAQFKAFVLENPHWRKDRIRKKFHTGDYLYDWNGNSYPEGEADYPVTYVSWYAAMAYSEWAEKRLPTEAEWEYAARGGLVGKAYPHGNTITPHDANYGRNVGATRAVGRYPANGYGLYDMAGNVFEWCLDEYDRGFYATFPVNSVARNPLSRATSVTRLIRNFVNIDGYRVVRGGAWNLSKHYTRVANRLGSKTAATFNDRGFRCVRTVSP